MPDRGSFLGTKDITTEAKRIASLVSIMSMGGPHPFLGSTFHSDTLSATVSRGSIIVGNATPLWSELVAGAAGTYLYSDGTDVSYKAIVIGDITDLAYAVPALTLTTANAEGAAGSVIRSDASILVFDVTVPDVIQCDDAAAAGAASTAARRDHTHGIVCAVAGSIAPDDSAAEGSASSFARSDHVHAIVCAAPGANLSVSTTNTEGSASSFARSDHSHAITSSSAPGAAASILATNASGEISLAGDLTLGTGIGIIHADGVVAGQFLRANGTRYVPDTLDVGDITDLAYATPAFTLSTSNAAGAASSVVRSDATILVFDVTVPDVIQCDDAAATGTASTAARRDHTHGIVCAAPGTNLAVATTNAEGAATSFARSDHSHAITSSASPGAAASILASDASGFLQLAGFGVGAAPASGAIIVADDVLIGLGAAAGRLVFDATPNPDQVQVATADLYIATTAHGIIHVDGVTAGQFLRADGTRYVPDTLDIADITDLAYGTPALTLTTANAAGAANTVMRTDASILIFDATVPDVIEYDDSAAAGAASVAARRDHAHGIVCAAPGTNLAVATTNAEGSASSFARSDHSHAITSSNNPGAAAAILATNASGFVRLAGLGIGAAAAANSITLPDGGWIGHNGARITFDDTDDRTFIGTSDNNLLRVSIESSKCQVRIDPNNAYVDNELLIGSATISVTSTGSDHFKIYTTGSGDILLDPNGLVHIGDTTSYSNNANMAVGLTINQGANDDELIAGKSSDVAHGFTDLAETDTYFTVSKDSGGAGGAKIVGYRDADDVASRALVLVGRLGEAADTTKSAAGRGIATLVAQIKSGTGVAAPGADANLLTIQSHSNTRWLLDQEGEMHTDAIIGIGDDWDDWDDLALAADLSRLPKAKYDEMLTYHAEDFERAGLVTLSVDENGQRHAFIRHKAMLMFSMNCFRELYQKTQRYKQALIGLGVNPQYLEVKSGLSN